LGQSNIAGGNRPATDWASNLQVAQNVAYCYELFCHHQATNPTGIAARNYVWHQLQPFQVGVPASGPLMGSWALDLGASLLSAGVYPAILDWCIGGVSLDYFVPGATGTQDSTFVQPEKPNTRR
jgi:hypothetical protein